PERYQTKIRRGQASQVTMDALPGRSFSAVVQAIDPLVDANGRSIGIRGCIDNRQLQLRPGMFARVTTVFSERPQARLIPEEALVPQGGRQFVIRLVDGPDQDTRMAQRIEVKLGLRSPGKVEIVEGLQPGDVVVTAGHQRIQKDGVPVRVVDVNRVAGPGGRSAGAGAPADVAPNGNGVAMAPSSGAGAPSAGATAPAAAAQPAAAAPPLRGANPCQVDLAAR
ncbi:MAG TPA: efflux RND transporter periplasmic adaptor subunit, partial [Lautropia sp.]|nr:efflux RND transporter periplasmic adaptor subunit [Lautropia sp.]